MTSDDHPADGATESTTGDGVTGTATGDGTTGPAAGDGTTGAATGVGTTGAAAGDGASPAAAPPRVLLVEDNPGDARLTREAFERCPREVELTVVHDGAVALERLRDAADLPSLVVLDRDLPGADGEAVLEELNEDPNLRGIPVVVFTTSDVPEHVRRMYERRANAYVTKPGDAAGFFECIERLDAFWFAEATLPEGSRS